MSELFRVLWPYKRAEQEAHKRLGCPSHVPWSVLQAHERQAHRNHGQSLETLHARGGLCPSELVAVLEDRPFRSMPDEEAVRRLLELLGGSR